MRNWLKLTVILGAAVAAGLLVVFDPARVRIFPPCPFHALTGLLCPGCGSTRALHQLINGHLTSALALNPLAVLLAPMLGYASFSEGLRLLRGRPLPDLVVPAGWIHVFLALVVAFGIARNIPLWPFTVLAP